jgi:hypothetical protein
LLAKRTKDKALICIFPIENQATAF